LTFLKVQANQDQNFVAFKSISIRFEVIYREMLDKCQWTDWLGCHGY